MVNKVYPQAEEWIDEEHLAKIEEWASNGLSLDEISKNIGISRALLYNWREKYPVILAVLKKGRDKSVELVENALFQTALKGNVVAQIFYLKNKMPDQYKDKVESTNTNTNIDNIKLKIE